MYARMIAFCVGLCLTGHAIAGDPEARALKAMHGTWKVDKLRYSGKELPKETLDQMRVEIAGRSMKVYLGEKVVGEATLEKVSPAKNPKEIDVLAHSGPSKGKLDLQCFAQEKDTLRFWNHSGPRAQRERYTKTPAGTEDDIDYLILKRATDK